MTFKVELIFYFFTSKGDLHLLGGTWLRTLYFVIESQKVTKKKRKKESGRIWTHDHSVFRLAGCATTTAPNFKNGGWEFGKEQIPKKSFPQLRGKCVGGSVQQKHLNVQTIKVQLRKAAVTLNFSRAVGGGGGNLERERGDLSQWARHQI